MVYRVSAIWTGTLDDFVEGLGDKGKLVAAVPTPDKPKPAAVRVPENEYNRTAVQEAVDRIVGHGSVHLTPSERTVIDILGQSLRAYSYSEVDSQLNQRGYEPKTGSAVLSTLVQKGKVLRVSRGMYQLA